MTNDKNTRRRDAMAVLALADGRSFCGQSVGASGVAVGEVVFNTAMTGYQEILTDPSYTRQIVTLTYPHIGNTGVNGEDNEANRVFASALIVRDLCQTSSNFRATDDLSSFLPQNNTVALAGIDTRSLTRHLREHGAQPGCVVTVDRDGDIERARAQALAEARAFSGLAGMDLAGEVSTAESYSWRAGVWRLATGTGSADEGHSQNARENDPKLKVVAYDFGVKRNILRLLVDRGATVTVVNARTRAEDVLAMNPDGVFLSNGPGDPEPCDYAIAAVRTLLEHEVPIFGICLGHQILALAAGGRTTKMKFGHHGANHPVQDLDNGRVFITSQNHGFSVDDELGDALRVTHRSLFDGSIQGITHLDKPAFSFQGHPEASPGPNDMAYLFDRFQDLMSTNRTATRGVQYAAT